MTRRKGGGGERHGRAVLGPNGEGRVSKPADKPAKKKKKLTYLERIAECDVSEELRVSISLALKKLQTSEDMKELELPSSLSSEERKYVHIVSQQMGFKSKSRGLLAERRLVLMKKDESEMPVRQRSWKRQALKYGGVQELLKQKAERRRVRDMQAENERLTKLEDEKSKVFDFRGPPPECSHNGSSTSASNGPPEVPSTQSNDVDIKPPLGIARLPMRRNEATRHLQLPNAVPAARRCSEGDASYNDHHDGWQNRSYPPRGHGFRGHYSHGMFGSHGDRPAPNNMRESPHFRGPASSSDPPPREGADTPSFSRTSHRDHAIPSRDHFNTGPGPRYEQGLNSRPYDFLPRPPSSHPYSPNPVRASSPRRRHSLHSPAFFNSPPPVANSTDYRHHSSHVDIRSSDYNVIAPSEPKWSDYGYYSNSLDSSYGPEFVSCSIGDFNPGAVPPNPPSGANVAFPPPDHSVMKTEPPEVKYEPYDPLEITSSDYRRPAMPPYRPSDISIPQASGSHYSPQPNRAYDSSFDSSSYSNITIKDESLDEHLPAY